VITSSTRSATIPTPNTAVTITTRAATLIASDTVSAVAVFYNTTTAIPNRNFAGPYTQVNATRSASNDSVWTANIPGFAAGTFVNYFTRATSSNGLSLLDIDTSAFKNFYRVAASPSILDVQFSPYDNTATSDVVSPLLNQTITVRGVVTADSADNLIESTNAPRAVHIQDGTGLWSGVRVVVDNYTVPSGTIVKGDSVTVTGRVGESSNYTQIDARSSANGSISKIAVAASPIAPLQLTAAVLGAQSEAYEGMLVQVNDVRVTRSNLSGFEFAVRENNLTSGQDYLVDDLSGWAYRGGSTGGTFNPINPSADTVIANLSSFASLRGIHFFSFNAYKLTPPRSNGFTGYQLNATEKGNPLPTKFALAQNYPNPFNPTTTIRYDLSERSNVKLKIYDVIGREIATLVNASQGQGAYQVPFNASALASGVYFYRLEAGSFVETKKMLLVK
jgi:DNA/RNA endonuclease YhcR with UshA esterase domain